MDLSIKSISSFLVKKYDDLNDQADDILLENPLSLKNRVALLCQYTGYFIASRIVAVATAAFFTLSAGLSIFKMSRTMFRVSGEVFKMLIDIAIGLSEIDPEKMIRGIDKLPSKIEPEKTTSSLLKDLKEMSFLAFAALANLSGIVSPSSAAKLTDKLGYTQVYETKRELNMKAATRAEKLPQKELRIFHAKIHQKNDYARGVEYLAKLEANAATFQKEIADMQKAENSKWFFQRMQNFDAFIDVLKWDLERKKENIEKVKKRLKTDNMNVICLVHKYQQIQLASKKAVQEAESAKRHLNKDDIYSLFVRLVKKTEDLFTTKTQRHKESQMV